MALFYSKAQGGFFDDTIHDAIPADACAISTELHASLLERQSMGLCIVGDEDGLKVNGCAHGFYNTGPARGLRNIS